MKTTFTPQVIRTTLTGAAWLAAFMLSGCGGGGGGSADVAAENGTVQFEIAAEEATLTLVDDNSNPPAEAADALAQPLFHLAPVVLDEPDAADALDNTASARRAPHTQRVPTGLAGLSSQRLTLQDIESGRMQIAATSAADEDSASAFSTGTVARTYTPAQIRAAYGLPALPVAGASLTAAQAAQLGAGQTIYIVDAMHNPNAAAELAAFNKTFGLPGCTSQLLPVGTGLPLAAAPKDYCVLSIAYTTTAGALTNTAPAYNAGWATEIALDVQWAHAIAPLARIVLIEAPDPSVNSLTNAVKLANQMGPGVVSMSFGLAEASWTTQLDSAFAGAGMSYLAATGDSGAAVSWPSVSSRVLAVGGTSLSYAGSGARTEVAWTKTGGGLSAYVPTPTYQNKALPGVGSLTQRGVADVAFNADPMTGQYVAIIKPGSTTQGWVSAGGTSISAPQWAGLIAAANAMRALAGKPLVGAAHATLYGQMAAVPGTYAATFADISTGANGSCGLCAARAGYDVPTGLGTPNVGALLSTLAGSSTAAAAPVVASASVSGKVGAPLSFSVVASAANPLSYSLSGAPAGLTISSTGVVSWAKPVAGLYKLMVSAKDSVTGLSGQGSYAITISGAALPPVIKASAMSGVAGRALTGTIAVSDPGGTAMSIRITGIPVGMGFRLSGQTLTATWARPVTGSYTLAITVTNALGLTTKLALPVTIKAS